jgi:hypothetical protein
MIIAIKKIFKITRGEHLQEVPMSTFLTQKGELLILYSHRISGSRLPHTGKGQLRINK